MASGDFAEADEMEVMDTTNEPHPKSEQPFAWPNPPQEHSPGWKAEQLAAEAMASDLSKWIVFDPSESGVEELENFLQINSPSVVERFAY